MPPNRKMDGERLVKTTTQRLRDLVLAVDPGTLIGSLRDLAARLGVGIVTFQQAARVLEHEGFLQVRRGPTGGYFGARPDVTTVMDSIAGYLLSLGPRSHESIEIMTLLDCEIMAAAASCADEGLRESLRRLDDTIDDCQSATQRVAFENEMHRILFGMIDRPLMSLLARVTMRHYAEHPDVELYVEPEDRPVWRSHRHDIISAILKGDAELARFQADRRRRDVLGRLARGGGHG